jgi:hypothetical protein
MKKIERKSVSLEYENVPMCLIPQSPQLAQKKQPQAKYGQNPMKHFLPLETFNHFSCIYLLLACASGFISDQ